MGPSAGRQVASETYVVHECSPGLRPNLLPRVPDQLPPEGVTVLWVDVPPDADPAEVVRDLAGVAPALGVEDVEALIERDELPRTTDRADGLRNASFVGFTYGGPQPDLGGSAELTVQMVETLVGDRLVLSCWQPCRRFRGTETAEDGPPVLREEVTRAVLRTWLVDDCESASDLASCVAQGLLVQSRAMVVELEHALQSWELSYHTQPEEAETETLKRLLAMVNEVRRRLAAFENARPLSTVGGHRFENSISVALEHRVELLTTAGLKRCAILLEGIRASMELVSMDTIAQQAVTAERRAKEAEGFQGRLEKVTALLLVPTLIAGIFGANTALPGGGTWAGFDTMLVLMVLTSLSVYFFLVSRRDDRHAGFPRRWSPRRAAVVGATPRSEL